VAHGVESAVLHMVLNLTEMDTLNNFLVQIKFAKLQAMAISNCVLFKSKESARSNKS